MATLETLVNFDGTNGDAPVGNLIANSDDDLIGTTSSGGAYGYGEVFEIAKVGDGYASSPTVLFSFNSTDGAGPDDALVADAAGDLFGTTTTGGAYGDGEVFELVKTADGYASTPTVLFSFKGTDGANPRDALVIDSAGDLFGTTQYGGASDDGLVFELVKSGGVYAGSPVTLATFTGANGSNPYAGLAIDSAGDLFGTTKYGGADDDGLVFEIAKSGSSYAAMTTLTSFNGTDGQNPLASLTIGAGGNLFGTTSGGGANDDGVAFEIAKTGSTYASSPTTLVGFDDADGFDPYGGLIQDAAGNLFGDASGGANGVGVVYEIAKTGDSYSSTPTVLANLSFTSGALPYGGLFADASGNLLGMGIYGGSNTDGAVFEVTQSGYVACYGAGTRIATPSGEVAVEKLAVGDCVVTASGEAKPITWLGHRKVDCARHPEPHNVWPVRVLAGAFGDNKPARDLWLSPGHNVDIGGALAPIRAFVNGLTVVQVERASVEYWHVELERHDVILAEGLPAESYLDTGNRTAFINGGAFVEAHPDFEPRHWSATCLPLVQDGPEIERVRALLLARAGAVGFVTAEADVHIVADGRRIEPTELRGRRLAFILPEGCQTVRLASRTFVPAEMEATSRDMRTLGVCVGRLQLDGVDIALDDAARFAEGWHDLEPRRLRWTRGSTPLPAGTRLVVIELAADGRYWIERRDNVVARFG